MKAEQPAGEVGRLRYRGPGVSRLMVSASGVVTSSEGAWNEPGDLARISSVGPHTACRARQGSDHSRRREHLSGGDRSRPAQASGDSEVSVFGASDTQLGERVVAAIVAKAGAHPEVEDVRAFARSRLASYKIPDRIVFVADLPRNSSGKVVRSALPKLFDVWS